MAESIRLSMEGLEDLVRQLRQLPMEMQHEASATVTAYAQNAMAEMQRTYPVRNYGRLKGRGNLVKGLRIDTSFDNVSSRAVVRNRAPHAYLFDHGTATRRNARGKLLGAAPPGRVFIPIAERWKTRLIHALVAIVERAGFTVRRSEVAA